MMGLLVLLAFGCTTVTSEIIGESDCKSVCERDFRWCFDRCQRTGLSSAYSLSCAEKCNDEFGSCKQSCPAGSATNFLNNQQSGRKWKVAKQSHHWPVMAYEDADDIVS